MRSGRIRAAADEVLRAHGGVIVVRKPVAVVVVASVKSDRLDPQSASFIVLSRKREESNPLLASELNTASNLTAGGHGVLQKKRECFKICVHKSIIVIRRKECSKLPIKCFGGRQAAAALTETSLRHTRYWTSQIRRA